MMVVAQASRKEALLMIMATLPSVVKAKLGTLKDCNQV